MAIDFKLSVMKPLEAKWLIELFDYLKTNNTIVSNGFKAAGIIDIFINPQRMREGYSNDVGVCVCLSVCLYICYIHYKARSH